MSCGEEHARRSWETQLEGGLTENNPDLALIENAIMDDILQQWNEGRVSPASP
jgi:hypothetical protein